MKNLDDIAKEHGIDNIDLGNAVEAIIASRNGKTYEMQYLTDEETAVINAMRMGAKVTADFFDSNIDDAKDNRDELSAIVDSVLQQHLKPERGNEFEYYEINIGDHKICHYID